MQKKWNFKSLEYNPYKIDCLEESRLVFALADIKIENKNISEIHGRAVEIQKQYQSSLESALKIASIEQEIKLIKEKLVKATRENIELRLLNQSAKEMAEKDSLTGLANRYAYKHKIENEISRFERENEPVSLIMLDIDHFKSYNDKYGHLIGDDVLRLVANLLKGHLPRKTDMIARYGGEEFVVVLPNTDNSGASSVAEKLRSAIEKETKNKKFPPVTISLGYATLDGLNKDLEDPEKLQIAADTALYHSKHNGRNQASRYEKGMKMPSQLEKLTKKILHLNDDMAEFQAKLILKRRKLEIIQKSNELDLIDDEKKDIAEITKKISEIQKGIKEAESAIKIEKSLSSVA